MRAAGLGVIFGYVRLGSAINRRRDKSFERFRRRDCPRNSLPLSAVSGDGRDRPSVFQTARRRKSRSKRRERVVNTVYLETGQALPRTVKILPSVRGFITTRRPRSPIRSGTAPTGRTRFLTPPGHSSRFSLAVLVFVHKTRVPFVRFVYSALGLTTNLHRNSTQSLTYEIERVHVFSSDNDSHANRFFRLQRIQNGSVRFVTIYRRYIYIRRA